MSSEAKHELNEDRQSIWLLTVSPAIWAAHFLASYIGAAVWCGKLAGRLGEVQPIRILIVSLAVVALAGIAFTGWRGWVKHSHREGAPPYDSDTPEDRHRFLGFATVLLSVLSAIATIYVAMSTLFIGNCI